MDLARLQHQKTGVFQVPLDQQKKSCVRLRGRERQPISPQLLVLLKKLDEDDTLGSIPFLGISSANDYQTSCETLFE